MCDFISTYTQTKWWMNNVIRISGALTTIVKFSVVCGYLSYDNDYAVESTRPSSLPNSKELTRTGYSLAVSGHIVPWSFSLQV